MMHIAGALDLQTVQCADVHVMARCTAICLDHPPAKGWLTAQWLCMRLVRARVRVLLEPDQGKEEDF